MSVQNNLGDYLKSVADSIRNKKGTTDLINPQDFPTEIESIKTGSSSEAKKDVNFYDYDGTILYSYNANEFLALKEMPALPEREGLICQEWNWGFEDAKQYVSQYNVCEIGATYITDDGKTRLYINIEISNEVILYFKATKDKDVTVDWGDGSISQISANSSTGICTVFHPYSDAGEYIISINPEDDCVIDFELKDTYSGAIPILLYSRNNKPANIIRKIEIGKNVVGIGERAFYELTNITSITIPKNVTTISKAAFYACKSLQSVIIPYGGVETIGSSAFYECMSVKSISIPNSVMTIGDSAFAYCQGITSINFPESVTSIGSNVVGSCYNLQEATIPNGIKTLTKTFYCCYNLRKVYLPNTLTTLNATFDSCSVLQSLDIPNSVTTLGSDVFSDCDNLKSIKLSDNIESIPPSCLNNTSISSLEIPDKVTTIGSSAFAYMKSLLKITMLGNITSIANYAFERCENLLYIDFRAATVIPVVSNTSAFTDINSGCKIVVPDALYDDWKAATNWSYGRLTITKASEFNG